MDQSDLIESLCSGCIIPTDKGIRMECAYRSEFHEEIDIPENRLIKDLLQRVLSVLERIEADIDKNERDLSETYFSNRVSSMKTETYRMLSTGWMNDVGELDIIPFNSSVLQKKHGYRELFTMYQMLGLGSSLSDDQFSILLEGHNKKVYQIYEYWCYIQLYKCLFELSTNKPDHPLETSGKGLTISPKRQNNLKFIIPSCGFDLEVKLLYNREFTRTSNPDQSYSLPLRPDYTLVVYLPKEIGGTTNLINFDAKYKVKYVENQNIVSEDEDLDSDCWAFDIYKMHTYRDALLKSNGSYVLYPGDKTNLFEKEGDGTIIPSVGSISLVPGDSTDTLKMLIERILEKLVKKTGSITLDIN